MAINTDHMDLLAQKIEADEATPAERLEFLRLCRQLLNSVESTIS